MRRVLGTVLVVALLVASAAPAPAAAQESPDETTVSVRVQVQADGDARWVVATRVPIDGPDDRATFEEVREAFEAGEADVDFSLAAFRNAATAASRASDREMTVTAVDRDTRIANESADGTVGVLELSFTWTEFARQDNDSIVVGDAFNATDGTWLPGLTAGQWLVLEPPPGYGVDDAPLATDPESLDDGVLTWVGPQTFEPGDLAVTYVKGGDSPLWSGELPDDAVPLAAGGLGIVVVLAGVYLWNRNREDDRESPPAPGGPASGDGGVEAEDAGDEPEPSDEGAEEETVDPELLSDEERVLHLLERNGGRMKQANIVTETGWSNAKVSQLLSAMADEGEVEKLRIGRENLISLPDEEPGEDL